VSQPRAVADAVTTELHEVGAAYAGDANVELGGYAAVVSAYIGLVGLFALLFRRSGRRLPQGVPLSDIGLLGVATFKLSRLVTRAKVTAFLRAPFTHYRGHGKGAEVNERARGEGVQRAVGELVTCPFCTAQWLATGLAGAYVLSPEATRLAGATLAAVTIADGLQYAHTALQARYG
jgi:hypothetical protein